ncbi:hypothetical protein [Yersinia enterocolitica]|uniref:hypothetical protein n=1 Tax=Yersinia enterocolitica TaxID=630 RepID=UPI00398CABAB
MLSKEQLEKIANQGPVDIGGAQNPIVTEMAAELLSLREQLAELKALEPVAWIDDGITWRGRLSFTNPDEISEQDKAEFELSFTPLFTAAKPEALPRHIFSMLVNELRDVPAIGCKRELIVSVLNRHGVIAEPVGD